MPDPRGLIQREVLGKKRKLRARLSYPADYELRTGQKLAAFLEELERLEEDPFAYDADHLLAAVAELCEGGGEPLSEEDIENASLGDMVPIIRAINDALVETGLMQIAKDAEADAKKKRAPKKPPSKSRGKTGKK